MQLETFTRQARVPVTILKITGNIDSLTFPDLLDKVKELKSGGAQYLLLDMAETAYLSSAGIMALYNINRIMKNEPANEFTDGWSTLRSMDREKAHGKQELVKLYNPQLRVLNLLEMVGFDQFFDIYTNLDEALKAF